MADILLVEDDGELSDLVGSRLREAGFSVRVAPDGPTALAALEHELPDIVLLDIMLPGMDGLEVCRRIRMQHPLLYVIMLTARTSEIDRVVGLEVGADDYVTKPFSLEELVARIRSALRRVALTREQASDDGEQPVRVGRLFVDPARREVTVDDEPVHLTVREFDLLLFLARHPDRPFTRMQLLSQVWDIHYEGYDRTVDSHVQRLRAKIEPDPSQPRYVRTVWGVGYKMASEPEPR
jgi:DNA-binding response OmpR family regulator